MICRELYRYCQPGIGRLESVNTGSVYTAHLQVDKNQRTAYAANYGGSTLSVISLADLGGLGQLEKVESYGEGCRDASHPHQTVTSGDWVWVVDLGCDTIWHYKQAGGETGLTMLVSSHTLIMSIFVKMK